MDPCNSGVPGPLAMASGLEEKHVAVTQPFLVSPNFLNKDGKLGLVTFATVCQLDGQGKIPLIMADSPEDADD